MRAVHLPGAPQGEPSPYSYPDKEAKPDALRFSTDIPQPEVVANPSFNTYILRVEATAFTKGELTWPETLERDRFRPFAGAIPGHDVVGTITTVHHARSAPVPKYKPGDHVWGLINFDRDGAAAEYALVLENEITLTPTSTTRRQHPTIEPSQLAAIPLSGLTAWQALYTHGHLPEPANPREPPTTPRKRVLITGASGTVGLLAIQLARLSDIHITAVCSSRHTSFLQHDLQCDAVLDYTAPNFHLSTAMRAQGLEPVDVVIEGAGGQISADVVMQDGVVKPSGGRIVSISGPLEGGLATLDSNVAEEVKWKLDEESERLWFGFFIVKPDVEQLDRLGTWVGDGTLRPFVDEIFDLEGGRDAMERVEGVVGTRKSGRGKVVLRVR